MVYVTMTFWICMQSDLRAGLAAFQPVKAPEAAVHNIVKGNGLVIDWWHFVNTVIYMKREAVDE